MSQIFHDIYNTAMSVSITFLSGWSAVRWIKRDTDDAICGAVFATLLIVSWKLL